MPDLQTFAIIPAAGRSERMGQPKLLLPWGTSTVIEHVIAAWRASTVTRVVLVAHPDDEQLAEVARRAGAIVIQPAIPPEEMKASVRVGLEAVTNCFQPKPSDTDAWLLAPADMPLLSASTIDQLIAAYRASLANGSQTPRIWAPSVGGRRGHPVLFPWTFTAQVAQLAAHEGLNALLARNPVELVEVGEATILEDLDTPDDYERLRTRHNG